MTPAGKIDFVSDQSFLWSADSCPEIACLGDFHLQELPVATNLASLERQDVRRPPSCRFEKTKRQPREEVRQAFEMKNSHWVTVVVHLDAFGRGQPATNRCGRRCNALLGDIIPVPIEITMFFHALQLCMTSLTEA
jgi:hypothetical protein